MVGFFSRMKKGESRRQKLSRYNYVESGKADIASMKNPHVPLGKSSRVTSLL
jgi:hypothetical protein